jgi:hypothetical protein
MKSSYSNFLPFSVICFFFFSTHINSQSTIGGLVLDANNKPIPFVNVVVTPIDTEKILQFTISDDNGMFNLEMEKEGNYIVSFSALGYKTHKNSVEIRSGLQTRLTIVLEEKLLELNEVLIEAERPISVKKDTINFKTKFFINGTEQTVEDLLQKIPGLQIDNNGTIKVGNQEIEKLMVDGDDLFERGYKMLSKNMPAYPIEEVEILKNYSNNRLLKGVEESDKVALNLKLNEKSKRIWFGNVETGLGNDHFYQLKGNLMNFGKRNKYYFLTNLNTIGYDATGDIENLIRPFRINEPASIGDDQTVQTLLNLSPNQLSFKKSRTNFNNAELVSLNAIFNPTEKLKIKTLGFFNGDETGFFRNSIDVIDVNETNFTNTEDYQLRNEKQIAFGKLDFAYNISKTKMLETATKYNNGDFDDTSNLLFNGTSTIENLQHQNSLFDQKITYTNKIKDKKVLLFTGRFIDEKTPQRYRLNQFFYQDLFPENDNANHIAQWSENRMQFVGINAHLLNRTESGHLLELQWGNEYRKDQLTSEFSILENETTLERPNRYQNQTSYLVNNLYFKSKYRLKINNFGLTGKLECHQLFNQLDNNGVSSDQRPFFINPSLGFDWKIKDKNKIVSSYTYNTTNADILDVYSDFVLTGFRSFSAGTGNFNQLEASNFVLNHQFGNWRDRFFANTFIVYSKNHDFFSTNTIIEQNYTQSEKIRIEDREFININSKLDYFFKFIASNLKLDVGYTQNEFKNIVNGSDLREITSINYNYGWELRSGFNGVFNFHLGTKWSTTQIQTTIENAFTDNISFMDASFVFNDKFNVQLQSERYHFGNLQTDNTYYFFDFDARWTAIKNKLTFGLSGRNLFNTQRFRNFTVSDIGTATTQYRLLPRFVLLKMEYRF